MDSPIRNSMSERGPKSRDKQPPPISIDMYGCEPAEARLDGEPPLPEAREAPMRPLTDTSRLTPIRRPRA
jgi:hypothetical protein